MQKRVSFPFSAIVSLDKLKLAILINAINPKIGGVLIQGPKGSGKTTAVRGLTDILPRLEVIKGCPFNCNPHDASNMCEKCGERYRKGGKLPIEERTMVVVNLPLGATEDRVIGSIDVEKAIKHGVEALEPGVLAEANQNILYVDEINLLPDHIADDLLDAAATGWNVVEREGISVSHPARFIFIGTMNPEEGQLRPQLLDRFPLSVSVERIVTVKDRMEVVKRNLEFETDPEGFIKKYKTSQDEMKTRIARARKILPEVEMPEELLEAICKTCLDLKVDGMRPDIVISKAACTLVAFENRSKVAPNDILVAAELALRHRTREGGFLEPATPEEISKVFMAKVKEVKYVEETKTYERVIESLESFVSVLRVTQDQLRDEFLKTVNYIMNHIWSELYPYGDFSEIRILVEKDYVLQLKGRRGWVNVDLVSGGERSLASLALRVAFSLAFTPNLRWLILDEPTHNLDVNAIEHFGRVLRDRMENIIDQVFLITHEERLSDYITGSIYRLERDKEMDGVTKVISS